jgi:hypothetical protein
VAGFIGDALVEHAGEQMQRGVGAERNSAACHQFASAVHQHRPAYVDPRIVQRITSSGGVSGNFVFSGRGAIIEHAARSQYHAAVHTDTMQCNA